MVIARDQSALDETGRRLLAEGLAALPDAFGHSAEEMLPSRRHYGRCRICGQQAKLTREHVPPGAALNLGRTRLHRIDEWLQRQGDVMPGGVLMQGGNWGYTLCKSCNDLTGARYGNEYKRWAMTFIDMLAESGTNVRALDAEPTTRRGAITLDGREGQPAPRPGAFVRQVLAMFCSVSAGFDLAGRFPPIRRILLDGATEPLPTGMSLGITIYLNATRSRIVGGPMLMADTARGSWSWMMEVAHPPIASLLIVRSSRADGDPAHVCDISRFTEVSPDAHARVDANIEISTAYHAQIGDYRTRAQVEGDARETVLVPARRGDDS